MTAREWLEGVRIAAAEIEPLQRELTALMDAQAECVTWRTSHGGGGSGVGTHSDPTATLAQARISELDRLVEDARSRLRQREQAVGDCGILLMRMEAELGRKHRDVIECYYIDRAATWSEVAYELGMHRDTVRTYRDAAFEWLEEDAVRRVWERR